MDNNGLRMKIWLNRYLRLKNSNPRLACLTSQLLCNNYHLLESPVDMLGWQLWMEKQSLIRYANPQLFNFE